MLKAILFDVDGTLIDSNDLHAHAWAEAFRQFGFDLPLESIREQIGKGGDNLLPSLLPGEDGDRCGESLEDFCGDVFKRCYMPRITPFPRVRDLFERLAQDGIKIVLASSARADEVAHHKGLIGAEDLVTATTSRDDVDHSKPCADIFQAALAKVAPLGPEEVAVVGDSPWDVEAAAKVGLRTVALRCGGFAEETLRAAGAIAIFDDPADLLARYDDFRALLG